MAVKGRNKPRTASKNVTDKREAKTKLEAAKNTLAYSGIMYPITKQLIEVAKRKGEDKTNPEGFARMVKEAEEIEKALKDKAAAEKVLKKFKGNQDFRKGGMVLLTVDNRKKK